MVKKRVVSNNFSKEIKRIDKVIIKSNKDFNKDVKKAEKWMLERTKFFKKLGWLILLLILLFMFAYLLRGY